MAVSLTQTVDGGQDEQSRIPGHVCDASLRSIYFAQTTVTKSEA